MSANEIIFVCGFKLWDMLIMLDLCWVFLHGEPQDSFEFTWNGDLGYVWVKAPCGETDVAVPRAGFLLLY